MHLVDFKSAIEQNPQLNVSELISIDAKKIYYLISGRNAWHSTWVQRYYHNCIATRVSDLEKDAETRREKGSVFYIKELPALSFETNLGVFLTTQINTQSPLENFLPPEFLQNTSINTSTSQEEKRYGFYAAQYLGDIAKSFQSTSACWKKSPSAKDSVFCLYMPGSTLSDLDPLGDLLYKRSSQPSGSTKNSICWSIKQSQIKSTFVKELALLTFLTNRGINEK